MQPQSLIGKNPSGAAGGFLTTRWSMVVRAGDSARAGAEEALGSLCRDYWRPLYFFARRKGHSPEDAQDVTQGFFLHLLEGGMLRRADVERGRFRTFLLGAMQNFLANEHRRGQAQKRGGGATFFSIDELAAEEQFRLEPADALTPELLYERNWAFALLERVGQRLGEEYARAGREAWFAKLQPYIAGQAGRYEELAAALGMSAVAVRVAIHRMRRRYGELLREEIAHTVSAPEEVEAEIAHLFEIVARV